MPDNALLLQQIECVERDAQAVIDSRKTAATVAVFEPKFLGLLIGLAIVVGAGPAVVVSALLETPLIVTGFIFTVICGSILFGLALWHQRTRGFKSSAESHESSATLTSSLTELQRLCSPTTGEQANRQWWDIVEALDALEPEKILTELPGLRDRLGGAAAGPV